MDAIEAVRNLTRDRDELLAVVLDLTPLIKRDGWSARSERAKLAVVAHGREHLLRYFDIPVTMVGK